MNHEFLEWLNRRSRMCAPGVLVFSIFKSLQFNLSLFNKDIKMWISKQTLLYAHISFLVFD